jgi:hypothetical protein
MPAGVSVSSSTGAHVTIAKTAGRVVGALILAQMIAGMLVHLVLTAPLFGVPGFLLNAAAHASQIAFSVLLGLAMAALSIAIVVVVFPLIRPRAEGMALALLALAAASFAVTAVEQISVMSMVSLSEAYAQAGATEREAFRGLRIVVASARNWAHYVGLIIGGGSVLLLYAAFYRLALAPRALAALGMAAAALQMAAVAMPLFGIGIIFPLLAPLALTQLVLALWLLARGFRSTVAGA